MWIELDTDAGTQILRGGGTRPLEEFDSLRWDVTAAAYWLKPGGLQRTFVIGGVGGPARYGRSVDVQRSGPASTWVDRWGDPYPVGCRFAGAKVPILLARSDRQEPTLMGTRIHPGFSTA